MLDGSLVVFGVVYNFRAEEHRLVLSVDSVSVEADKAVSIASNLVLADRELSRTSVHHVSHNVCGDFAVELDGLVNKVLELL